MNYRKISIYQLENFIEYIGCDVVGKAKMIIKIRNQPTRNDQFLLLRKLYENNKIKVEGKVAEDLQNYLSHGIVHVIEK